MALQYCHRKPQNYRHVINCPSGISARNKLTQKSHFNVMYHTIIFKLLSVTSFSFIIYELHILITVHQKIIVGITLCFK